ncbi:preprotein translocase subunit SecY [Halococcoides cellulosivorans]|uniref:Protein translocase subunit SecY n=1 Tax=Halococcoides cellulosivorans TaxID=1679096 RepID=A0A2R4X2B8_9EURY|nr:preprotein translocase subunit SecY [Halococcoides cellulosivorans]AWB27925.1 preprotein translocase subunit SecY [Halococcoides cellulosivorans]
MSWKDTAEPVLTRMPTVRRPQRHVPFKRKLMWTAGILVLYFFLTNVHLFGMPVDPEAGDAFGRFRSILAGGAGTIMHLGIGPIVTASIVLQLLGGADLLGLDTENNPRDQVLYQGLQKFLVLVMICLTGLPMVFASDYLPASRAVQELLPIGKMGLKWLIFAQIALGGVLILYMDEIVSKWGVGSGVGLFIIAGVSQQLFGGLTIRQFGDAGSFADLSLGLIPRWAGFVSNWLNLGVGEVEFPTTVSGWLLTDAGLEIIPIITTILIFVIVVYAESVRVEIPLSHARVKGARGRFPVKLIYASVLPMILVRALQANIQFLGQILHQQWAGMPGWVGQYADEGAQVTGGVFYYLAPVQSRQEWMWWLGGQASNMEPWQIFLRVGIDLGIMVFAGGLFAIFWVETTGMGPESTAQQIQNSGMQIPGFRQNPSVLEKVLERYIPQVTVIGGMLVGFLAVMANLLGTIGGVSGTGLLLTVSITYKIYEEIAEEQLMEMHPMMRQMFG